MDSCRHATLVLVPVEMKRRCCRCHLTVSHEELAGSYCPECFEESGRRYYDFDDVEAGGDSTSPYVCEDCGVGVG